MAGRTSGYRHNEDTRAKIKAAQLINRLQKHVDSKTPLLDASQVNAAKALLAKVLPDLQAVTMDSRVQYEIGSELRQLLEAVNGRTRGIPKGR